MMMRRCEVLVSALIVLQCFESAMGQDVDAADQLLLSSLQSSSEVYYDAIRNYDFSMYTKTVGIRSKIDDAKARKQSFEAEWYERLIMDFDNEKCAYGLKIGKFTGSWAKRFEGVRILERDREVWSLLGGAKGDRQGSFEKHLIEMNRLSIPAYGKMGGMFKPSFSRGASFSDLRPSRDVFRGWAVQRASSGMIVVSFVDKKNEIKQHFDPTLSAFTKLMIKSQTDPSSPTRSSEMVSSYDVMHGIAVPTHHQETNLNHPRTSEEGTTDYNIVTTHRIFWHRFNEDAIMVPDAANLSTVYDDLDNFVDIARWKK